mmetsp:Transcript_50014/g.93641  ORF Transcript_50014/g.93641 Transcript_50014/m.93641 type:complete len:239 (-) Transcript_50014:68-784(-)
MGQSTGAPVLIGIPNKEDRWRYCCHLEGEVPIELQLASARTTAQYEAAMQQRRLYARSHQNAAADEWPAQWPGPVRSFPAVPRGPPAMSSGRSSGPLARIVHHEEDDHFPEVVRAGGSRHAGGPQARIDDSASDDPSVRSNGEGKGTVDEPAEQAEGNCRSAAQPDVGATSLVATPPRAEVGRSAASGVPNAPRAGSSHGPQVAPAATGPCRRAEIDAVDEEVRGCSPFDDESISSER